MHHLGAPALAAGDVCDGDVGGAEVVVAGIAQESRERKIALQPPSSARQNVSSYLGSSSCPVPGPQQHDAAAAARRHDE